MSRCFRPVMDTNLVAVSLAGLPCSGKTTLAREYSKEFIDVLYEPRIAQPLQSVADDLDTFLRLQSRAFEEEILRLNRLRRVAAQHGKTVIIQDRGCDDILCYTEYYLTHVLRADPSQCVSVAGDRPVTSLVVYIDIPSDVLDDRIARRSKRSCWRGLSDVSTYLSFYHAWFRQRSGVSILPVSSEGMLETLYLLDELIRRHIC